jgi:hypothetical protein
MKEISNAWYDRLEQDTAIRTFTGYTASDTRVYLDFPPEAKTPSGSTPAYITFGLSKPIPIDPTTYVEKVQHLDIIIETDVYANTQDLADDIAERITHIMKDREWNTTTYRVLKTDKEAEEDITEIHEATGQIDSYRKYMRFRLWPVYEKI